MARDPADAAHGAEMAGTRPAMTVEARAMTVEARAMTVGRWP